MIRNGDAIEVKKLEYQFSELQLNSSFPKDKLYASDPKISQACAEAEEWDEKDIFYCVGWVKDKKIAQILFIQGSCYAADHSTYQKIEDRITVALEEDKDTEYSETKELARVNNVDPLGVTNLRVRGMWLLRNPGKFFEDFLGTNEFDFRVAAIMLDEKYSDYKESSRQIIENIESIILEDIEIPNPNNPAKLLKAKLIKYEE